KLVLLCYYLKSFKELFLIKTLPLRLYTQTRKYLTFLINRFPFDCDAKIEAFFYSHKHFLTFKMLIKTTPLYFNQLINKFSIIIFRYLIFPLFLCELNLFSLVINLKYIYLFLNTFRISKTLETMKNKSIHSFLRRLFGYKTPPIPNPYNDFADFDNHSWIFREHEIHEQLPSTHFRTSSESKFELGYLLTHLYSASQEEVTNFTINDNGILDILTDPNAIWHYNLLAPFHFDQETSLSKHIFYTLLYRPHPIDNHFHDQSQIHSEGAIMLHCYPTGKYKGHTCYIQIDICLPVFPSINTSYHNSKPTTALQSFTIAYDYKRPSQALAEYNYMRESIDNYNDLKLSSLTENEWTLLQHIHPQLGNEFYWGKKAFNSNRYLDAILYFKNVYDTLKDTWYKKGLNAKEMSLLTECSYLIGYSYNDLKLYDQAYHYLELAGRSNNKSYKYKKEFVNCLVNSRNLLSIIYIDDYLQDLKNLTDNKKNEEDLNFFYFLLRRKAYILIEMEQFEDAEYILHRLLEKDPDNLIILKELAYIQHQRKESAPVAQERNKKNN
ncbi:MAG: tetratricopeptide repeat protein, partial [Bacteroidales bacterium]